MKNYIINAIVILFLYIILSSMYNSTSNFEGFTPKIRETYRPYLRNAKIYYDGFYNNTKNRANKMFRNLGLF